MTSLVEEHQAVITAIDNFWDARYKICNEVLVQGNLEWPKEFKVFIPNIINCSLPQSCKSGQKYWRIFFSRRWEVKKKIT